jgi:ankyrin repeat protein
MSTDDKTLNAFVRLSNCILNKKFANLENFERFNLVSLMDNGLLEIMFKDFPLEQQFYLINNAIDLRCRDKDQWTVLHHTIRYGNCAITSYLMGRLEMEDLEAENSFGWRPIHLAVMYCTDIAVRMIKKGVEINCPTHDGFYPIHLALRYTRSKRVYDAFLERPDIDLDVEDEQAWRPIHYAIRHNQIDFLRQNRNRLDIHSVTKTGKSVSDFAMRFLTPTERMELNL